MNYMGFKSLNSSFEANLINFRLDELKNTLVDELDALTYSEGKKM